MMLSIDDSARTALLLKAQEDFTGLWEFAGILNCERGFTEAESAARRLTRELWEMGLLQFVWGNPHPNEADRVPYEMATTIFDTSAYWNPQEPFEGIQIWAFTTPYGDKWLNEHRTSIQ
jgi:hypothetical protein